MARRPKSLLFACSQNAVRSPIAAAMARHVLGAATYVQSAGIRPGDPDAFAIAVMDEIGIDIAGHRPHTFEELEDASFDLIVTLSPEAHHWALELTRTMAVEVVYWPTPDPTAVFGTREQQMEAFRNMREGLARRIRAAFGAERMGSV